MISTVVGQYNWPPNVIDSLYLDSEDYKGLEYWYDRVCEIVAELKNKAQVEPKK